MPPFDLEREEPIDPADVCSCGRSMVSVCLSEAQRSALVVAMNDLFESSCDLVTIEAARRLVEALEAR